ncbi:DUF6556 family protein [Streptococcus ictaluri]|uniref:TBC1 domain family member 8B n=1 Tax=Streptococcus ictaluri 707-05 TaxID=764299 RepID=G5K3T7_9STRE|nr:DUF6556 family protein [Streptococcus ictaluri]EHI69730.1 hypothetical protein STRIC_1459 [Streptococcus ictaluri 707-05]
MSSQYSRQQKPKKTSVDPKKHLQTGFTALQKSIALIGSILSIVVATITITRALNPAPESKKEDSGTSSSNTIVKIIEKESSQTSKPETSHNQEQTPLTPTTPSLGDKTPTVPSTSASETPQVPSYPSHSEMGQATTDTDKP